MYGAGSGRGRAYGGEHRAGPGSAGRGGARARPRHLWRSQPIRRAPSVPSGPSVPGGEGAGRGGRREGAEASAPAERWNAGDAAGSSDMRAAGPDGAEGQGDHGGHRSNAAVAPAPACPAADRYPCGGWDRGFESLRPLQSDFLQPFSARAPDALRRSFRGTLRPDLEGAGAERGPFSLSGRQTVSGPWGFGNLPDKVERLDPATVWGRAPCAHSGTRPRGRSGLRYDRASLRPTSPANTHSPCARCSGWWRPALSTSRARARQPRQLPTLSGP